MKIFTKKFFLLAIGMILSVGASAQTPTGAWNAYEDAPRSPLLTW